MVKTVACRRAIKEILQMLVDDQQIPEDFMMWIDQCLSDYFYQKNLDYSITSLFEHRDFITPETYNKIKDIFKLNDEFLDEQLREENEVRS
ncbi:MAG: hypothetical protein ACTSU7_00050 [Candidatus Heimdallarchaeaceae archaeon]